jgi:hypothetical protein
LKFIQPSLFRGQFSDQDALQAEVDALKSPQAKSRRGLHAPLDALLPAILGRDIRLARILKFQRLNKVKSIVQRPGERYQSPGES